MAVPVSSVPCTVTVTASAPAWVSASKRHVDSDGV